MHQSIDPMEDYKQTFIKLLKDADDFIRCVTTESKSDYYVHVSTPRFEIISLNQYPELFFLKSNKSGKLSFPSLSINALKEWISDIEG